MADAGAEAAASAATVARRKEKSHAQHLKFWDASGKATERARRDKQLGKIYCRRHNGVGSRESTVRVGVGSRQSGVAVSQAIELFLWPTGCLCCCLCLCHCCCCSSSKHVRHVMVLHLLKAFVRAGQEDAGDGNGEEEWGSSRLHSLTCLIHKWKLMV